MGNRVKVISLGYAVPQYSYTQKEVFEALRYPSPYYRIFRDARINLRHFCVPIQNVRSLSFQQQQEIYLQEAEKLALAAALDCLDGQNPASYPESSVNPPTINLLTYSTCTGFPPGPTIGHYLAKDLRLPEGIQINNLSSQGCEAAFPGLRRCYDYTALTGGRSLAVACELTSLTYFPEPAGKPDPENEKELLRANAVFADGCSCALLGDDDDPRHPEIIDFSSIVKTEYMDELGYVWRDGRLRVRLSRRVPELATLLFSLNIHKLLENNGLQVKDISHWVLHPPGAAVINMVRDRLGIEEEKLKYSRQALRENGNTSSSSVGIVGKLLMKGEPEPKGYLVMANVGPGLVSNASLMRFG